VQGVGFRWFVIQRARRAGLRGWVRNRLDGAVECLAEGPRPALERLLEDLREGPGPALVSGVETEWQPATGDLVDDFDVAF
jgi:acylphosphatase